jgi:flagellar hook assembly protein FlgD
LHQPYPNPFNPQTQISYYLPRVCQVRLTIYNVLGREVNILFDGHQDAGMHTLIWDGRTDGGSQLSSEVYFYRSQAGSFQVTRKMTLMK